MSGFDGRATNGLGIRTDPRYRTIEEADIAEMLLLGGWPYEVRDGLRDRAAADASEALQRWVDLGLEYATCEGRRRFDPAEVVNFSKRAALRNGDPYWETRFIATSRRQVEEFRAPCAAVEPIRFAVSLRREYNLAGVEPGTRVRLRLPLPIEDAALRHLRVDPSPIAGVDARATLAPGRLEASFRAPPEPLVSIAAEIAFTALPFSPQAQPAALDDAERALYLRESEGFVAVTPRVRALAARLAGSKGDPTTVVGAFWDFVLDDLLGGILHYDEIDHARAPDSILDCGWFDCQLGSALIVSLCRARDIPARMCSGYFLYPTSPAIHYWFEVWIEGRGWLPYDLVTWNLSYGGRDAAWRNCFAGSLDYRLKTEQLPHIFTGMSTVRFPRAWHLLMAPIPGGAEIAFRSVETGAAIYRDLIAVRRL